MPQLDMDFLTFHIRNMFVFIAIFSRYDCVSLSNGGDLSQIETVFRRG